MAAGIISTHPPAESEDGELETERVALVVDEAGHGMRADRVLAQRLDAFSRAHLQHLIEDGAVTLNGAPLAKPAHKLKAGDALQVELRPTVQATAFAPEPMELAVVHEDADLLVIDKPAGLVVHPAAGHWSGTLLNGLLAYHGGAQHLPRAGIVHRLDKDTSGLMLVAKSQRAFDALTAMIAAREVGRLYLALAQGNWQRDPTVNVDRAIGRDSGNRLRMAALAPQATSGKPARTTLGLLDSGGGHSLVACKLHTGRTHQIRVHMAWLGHPLVGDTLYGGRPGLGLERQALHAHRLALRHPVDGRELVFDRPLPADMALALETAGLQYNGRTWWQAFAS